MSGVCRTQPEPDVIRRDRRIRKPARFAQMVASRADDRIIFARPSYVREKFRYHPALGRAAQVLAECPPAKIPRTRDVGIRTFESRHAVLHEREGFRIAYRIRIVFRVIGRKGAEIRRGDVRPQHAIMRLGR